ncbi:MAG: hypothetical protein J3R72DRAFT_524910 [Linnemannia gamsii]|nr:MAG: hypothetical protein J3R72DRAFT_524910 [Linnemannia gamsii]
MGVTTVLSLMLMNGIIGYGLHKLAKYRIHEFQMEQEQDQAQKQVRGDYEQIIDLEERVAAAGKGGEGDKPAPWYEGLLWRVWTDTKMQQGPFTVVRRTAGGSYELRDGTGARLGRNFAPSQLKLVLDDYEDTATYEIEKILDHRTAPGGEVEYYVSWKGFTEKTWEPQDNFVERPYLNGYWRIRDPSGTRTLLQPRQTLMNHETQQKEQEPSPLQRTDQGSKENGTARAQAQ